MRYSSFLPFSKDFPYIFSFMHIFQLIFINVPSLHKKDCLCFAFPIVVVVCAHNKTLQPEVCVVFIPQLLLIYIDIYAYHLYIFLCMYVCVDIYEHIL